MGRPVIQWQIISPSPDSTADFYGELFAWKVDGDNPLSYRQVDTGSERGIQGGIWPAPPEANGFVQLFIEVDDIEETVHRAEALGATVVIPPQTLPGGDEMAVIHDPQGIPLALFRPSS